MPTNEKPMTPIIKDFRNIIRINTLSNVVSQIKKPEFIDQIFDVVELLQDICVNLNSYFGKKVKFQF